MVNLKNCRNENYFKSEYWFYGNFSAQSLYASIKAEGSFAEYGVNAVSATEDLNAFNDEPQYLDQYEKCGIKVNA